MRNNNLLIIITGAVFGIFGVVLVKYGNPANMGYCIACFLRDTAGALGLHRAGVVQYIRPEIIGLVLGGFVAALFGREFKSRGGSAPTIRFLLGMLMMIGALMFLGCPLRGILRLAGGDLNGLVGLAGLAAGIVLGAEFLKRGYNLGKAIVSQSQAGGMVLPVTMLVLLALLVLAPVFNATVGGPVFFSVEGPGAKHAPLLLGLMAGLIGGVLAQRTRLCLSGGIRDFYLIRDTYLLKGFGLIFVVTLLLNLYYGQFNLGFVNQPIAHNWHVWNFLGLFLVGLSAVLLGGCPLRQLILSGEGDLDAGIAVLGMVAGAAVAHNFMLASSAAGPTVFGQYAVVIGLLIAMTIGWVYREV